MVIYKSSGRWFYAGLYLTDWRLNFWRNEGDWGLDVGPISLEWS